MDSCNIISSSVTMHLKDFSETSFSSKYATNADKLARRFECSMDLWPRPASCVSAKCGPRKYPELCTSLNSVVGYPDILLRNFPSLKGSSLHWRGVG